MNKIVMMCITPAQFVAECMSNAIDRPWYADRPGYDCTASTMWNRWKANEIARKHAAK